MNISHETIYRRIRLDANSELFFDYI